MGVLGYVGVEYGLVLGEVGHVNSGDASVNWAVSP
jgi:hypothetical protein